jgi:ATP-grasp ribosomal peptide maturase
VCPTVLVVTSLDDVTSDLVITALNRRGVHVVRVDPADLGQSLSFSARIGDTAMSWTGSLRTKSREQDLATTAAVYYRRPSPWRFDELPQQARDFATAEARHGLGGLLASLPHARYVNHPAAVARADMKPAQLQVAARLGFNVPPTLITNEVSSAREFAAVNRPVVYKTFRGLPPSADGNTGAIWTQRVDADTFDESLSVTAHLFQAEVRKSSDARVTVVGDRVFAQRITSPGDALDWRSGDWNELTHEPITVPAPIVALIRRYLAHFELVFGCFAFALTGPGDREGDWTWIECNPNGQWGWLPDHEQIVEAFADVLTQKDGYR